MVVQYIGIPPSLLVEQLKEGQEIATEGQEAIADSQLMCLAYDNIKNTGLYNDQCRLWRAKPSVLKTHGHLKTYFIEFDDRRQNETTSGTAGYSVNAVPELVHDEVASIVAEQPASTQEEMQSCFIRQPTQESANAVTLEEMKALFKTMLAEHTPAQPPFNRNPCQPLVAQGHDTSRTPITYCWADGITRNLKDCKRKKRPQG